MNGVFVFVLLLVTITLCARLIQVYIEQRQNRKEPTDDIDQTLAKIDLLEERVQVLERIITESRFDLKKEIDHL
jgi:high-affinity nickel permease